MESNLTEGIVWKKLLLFAIPIFGANLLQAMYGTVDLMIVGLFSDAANVSAVSTGSMTMQTVTGIITGLTMGCTVLLGQNIGRKDEKASAKTIGSSVLLFVIIGIMLAFIIVFMSASIAKIMNAPTEAMQQTTGYIRICGAGAIFIVLFNAIGGMCRGMGDSKTPLILMGIACCCNILGDLILTGVFSLGYKGVAIATVAAQGISVVCAYLIIHKKGFGIDVDRNNIKPAKSEMLQILKYGLPIAAQEALTGASFMIILAILNTFGLIASAGVGVAEKLCALMFIVPVAIMSAISAFTAQNVGADKRDRARGAMFFGMGFTFVIGLGMFFVSFIHGEWLSHFFTPDNEIAFASADYLRSYSLDCIIVGFNFSMMGYLNGNGKTAFVALQGILSTFLVRIPVSYFMSKIEGVSLFQVGFATPLATVFAIIITSAYLVRFEKKQLHI